jgi:hypothetical protein
MFGKLNVQNNMKKILYILIVLFIFSFSFFIITRFRLINIKSKVAERCTELYGMYKISDVPAVCYESFTRK